MTLYCGFLIWYPSLPHMRRTSDRTGPWLCRRTQTLASTLISFSSGYAMAETWHTLALVPSLVLILSNLFNDGCQSSPSVPYILAVHRNLEGRPAVCSVFSSSFSPSGRWTASLPPPQPPRQARPTGRPLLAGVCTLPSIGEGHSSAAGQEA